LCGLTSRVRRRSETFRGWRAALSDMNVSYNLKLSDDYVVEAHAKHRGRGRAHWLRWPVKLICALGLIALGALGTYADIATLVGCAAFMLFLLLLGPRIDYFVLRRRWRRVPQFNEEMRIEVSEQRIATSSVRSSATADWSAYECVVEFPDGVLLYDAPWNYFWLPDSKIATGTSQDVRAILRQSVRDYRIA
jgi:hypothetical protein